MMMLPLRVNALCLLLFLLVFACGSCSCIYNANLEKGKDFMRNKKFKQALEELKKAVEAEPKNAQAWHLLGNCLYTLQKFDEALEVYKKALKLDPKNSETHVHFGIMLRNYNLLEESVQHFKSAIQITPYDPNAYFNLGISCELLGRYNEAIEAFEKVIDINPFAPWVRDARERIIRNRELLKSGGK